MTVISQILLQYLTEPHQTNAEKKHAFEVTSNLHWTSDVIAISQLLTISVLLCSMT